MVKAGGEIDAFCTRCELELAHTVHAVVAGRPVRVECNTCHAVHAFRGAAGARPAARGSSRAERPRRAAVGFDDLLAARRGPARRYSPGDAYAVDDVVDHPTFGRGFVSAVRNPGKIEVTFRSEVRVLVHGRGRSL
jgi:hypothetical protein